MVSDAIRSEAVGGMFSVPRASATQAADGSLPEAAASFATVATTAEV